LKDITPLNAENGLQFWLDRESAYPRLSQLAEDLICSPAAQAYVERLFSLCGELTAGKRNRCRASLCTRVFLKLNRRVLL
jgi:hAT family C-terminal dimerisation region